ncbi:hypothetical protein UFOVP649_34 [uncultured Caudovirales phage]|uniref:Uncharacterized protein n=1 Tax=uncultured Caudovirales phage TaxID=2100421 RepID=A0A6J5N5R4_9CAUD|nr:hypothetical protein UFOVP649_34 [uncultured Caudovirales phage]
MAHFRIVQRPSYCDPTRARFDVQEKVLWWWELIDFEWTIEEAEQLLLKIRGQRNNRVETKVIKEYYL